MTQRVLNFDGGEECVGCGRTHHDPEVSFTRNFPATPVTWRCSNCGGLVCRDCALCLPEGHPEKLVGKGHRQYYDETFCSDRCRVIKKGMRDLKGEV